MKKYEIPLNIQQGDTYSQPAGRFPSFIPKTDQERIQNISYDELLSIFESGETFECTQKYNGSSITIYRVKNELTHIQKLKLWIAELFGNYDYCNKIKYHFGVCSRNLELKIDAENSRFVNTAKKEGYIEILNYICDLTGADLAIQGELIGENIQSNWHGIQGNTIIIFDIYNITEKKYLLPSCRMHLLNSIHKKFPHVKYADVIFTHYKLTGVDRQQFLNLAEYELENGKQNEGLVFKSNKRQFSFKAISNKFLLNGGV